MCCLCSGFWCLGMEAAGDRKVMSWFKKPFKNITKHYWDGVFIYFCFQAHLRMTTSQLSNIFGKARFSSHQVAINHSL